MSNVPILQLKCCFIFLVFFFLNNESNSSENCHTIKVSEKVCKETTFPLRSKVLVLILHDMLVIHFYFSAKLQVHEIFRCQIALKQASIQQIDELATDLDWYNFEFYHISLFRFSILKYFKPQLLLKMTWMREV